MTATGPPGNSLSLKPTHKAVVTYYDALSKFKHLGVKYETAVRSAFQELLEHCARQFDWKLVPEYAIKRKGKADAKVDGALLDSYGLNHGLWEAKDSDDDLDKEIKIKFALGYPKQNILFWQPDRAVLYRNSERFYDADLTRAEDLVHILSLFLEFAPPAIAEWQRAVEEFRDRVPQIGASLRVLIEKERQTNKKFIAAFEGFYSLCRSTLNPNISVEAVEEMIIQHILTERIFRKIFSVADFIQRNVIANEIETVITALNSRSFSRDDFSKSLEHFYAAIENAAATIIDFQEKQTFLNTVYERFFQGFCVKVADTHGIVYTPQPAKAKGGTDLAIFKTYSLGVSTNRDEVVYDFEPKKLAIRVEQFIDDYNAEVERWVKKGRPKDIDNFVKYDRVKWSRDLEVETCQRADFQLRQELYS